MIAAARDGRHSDRGTRPARPPSWVDRMPAPGTPGGPRPRSAITNGRRPTAGPALPRFDLGGTHAQRTLVRAALAGSPAAGLRLLVHPTTTYVWDGLMPSIPAARRAYEDFGHVDQDLAAFCDDMELQYGGRPPERWQSALVRPRAFFDAYVRDCAVVWSAMRSRLGDPQPILDREAERVGTAAGRGALPEMLASMLPGARLRGRQLVLPARRDKRLAIGSDGLVIVPMLASVRGQRPPAGRIARAAEGHYSALPRSPRFGRTHCRHTAGRPERCELSRGRIAGGRLGRTAPARSIRAHRENRQR